MTVGSRLLAVLPLAGLSAAIAAGPALAHTAAERVGGFESGLLHPITGLDHVVAMVAVGLWGGVLGAPAIWLLPVVFPLVMAVGGALGIAGLPLPGVEAGIALSGIVLGVMVLLAARPPLWIAAAMVGVFAIFHGYAHGAELPGSADPVLYSIGFVIATGMLHLVGVAIGQLVKWPAGFTAVRAAGAAIAVIGGAFLTGYA